MNDGSTLQRWPLHLLERLHKLNRSSQVSVRSRLQACVDRNASCYYGFEANPAFDTQLTTLQHVLRSKGVLVRLFTSTAFSMRNDEIDFLVEPFELRTGAIGSTTETNNILSYRNSFGHWKVNRESSGIHEPSDCVVSNLSCSMRLKIYALC